MNLTDLDAVFFDFDGVILDSTMIKTKAFQTMYHSFGDDVVNKVTEHHLTHGGISRVEKIKTYHEQFLGIQLNEDDLLKLTTEFSDSVKGLVVNSNWIPGAKAFLDKWHKTIPLFVVSGTPEVELHEIVKRRGMDFYFKETLGSPTKKPIHVNSVLNKEGYDSKNCVFVGDALTDLNAANETGLNFIGIQGEITFPSGTMVLPNCIELEKAISSI